MTVGFESASVTGAEVVDIVARVRLLQAEMTVKVAGMIVNNEFSVDGHRSAAGWLQAIGFSPAEAKHISSVARAMAKLPALAEAVTAGEVSVATAAIITTAATRHRMTRELTAELAMPVESDYRPGRYWTTLDEVVCDIAVHETPVVVRRAVAELTDQVREDRVLEKLQQQTDSQWVSLAQTFDGAWHISGMLAADTGHIVNEALHALMGPPAPEDFANLRTAEHRRADALGLMAAKLSAADLLPTVRGRAPQVTVTTTLDALRESRSGGAGAHHRPLTSPPAVLGDTPIPAALAKRLACDATVIAAIRDERGAVTDLGRSRRLVSSALRKKLELEQPGCAFPACGRPSQWCDAHHIQHWADGGPTDAANLVLLCKEHHTAIHCGGWQVAKNPATGKATIKRDSGPAP